MLKSLNIFIFLFTITSYCCDPNDLVTTLSITKRNVALFIRGEVRKEVPQNDYIEVVKYLDSVNAISSHHRDSDVIPPKKSGNHK